MSDGLENASGGYVDLDELAREGILVVARIKEFLPEETSTEGFKSNPVMADLLLCTGRDKGEVVRGMKIKKGGITNTLRRSSVGKDVAGALVVKKIEKRKDPFAAMDPCTGDQLALVKDVYRGGAGFDDNTGLGNAVPAGVGASSAGAAVSDQAPPF